MTEEMETRTTKEKKTILQNTRRIVIGSSFLEEIRMRLHVRV
jgi:hypothetical protein